MDHGSSRSFDCEGECVDNRVRHVKELHTEATGGNLVLVFDDVEPRLVEHPVLSQLVLYQRHREVGSEHRHIQIRKDER